MDATETVGQVSRLGKMRRTGWIAHCVLWPSAETAISPRSMRACLDCACRRARRSERIAARYGRKRLPSRWKEDAVRAALAEERGGANASRQDMGGKENCLRKRKAGTGRAALAEVRGGLDVSRKIRTEKKTAFAAEGGRRPGCDCRSTRWIGRIAARYGRKRKLPSQRKADAGRTVIAEERGEEVLPASCGSCPVGIFAFIRCGRRQRSRSRAPVRVPRSRRTAWPRIPDSHAKSVRPRRDGTWRIPSSTFKTPLRKDFAGADGPEDFPGVCIESMLREGVFYAPWKFLTFAPPSAGAI